MHDLSPSVFQRAKEDVLQKEVRVKILKDSVNVLISKTPSGGPDLNPELTDVLQDYQKLCDRFKSKCHTLEVHTHTHTHTHIHIHIHTQPCSRCGLVPLCEI